MSLVERDLESVWHPYTQMQTAKPPLPVVKAKDSKLILEDGTEIIDGVSSWWVTSHGHSNKYIAQKIFEQASTLEHAIFAGFTHPKAVELAERVLKILPNNQKRVFYSDNGSTAVEVGLKMAFQYWYNKGKQKTKIVAFNDAYHGDTFGAMAVSGRSPFTEPFLPFLFDVEYVDCPIKRKEEEVVKQFENIVKQGNVAAFIFEPLVQGAGGMVMYSSDVLDRMLAIAKQYDVICIADEVFTGFGRTGRYFATEILENKPDIYALSKGLTGGTLALGVTTCTGKIYDAFLSDDKMKTLFHGHSFTANAIACATACASLDLFEKPETWNNIKRIEEQHLNFQKELVGNKAVQDCRVTGTIIAVELVTGEDTSYFNSKRDEIYQFFIDRNILLRPLGNVIYIVPPYCTTDKQLDKIYTAIKELISA
jgi:adenosylmethionine-8-amino-7-oxononanoate aminotransferase